MTDYLKCVWWNKFTFFGYLSLISSAGIFISPVFSDFTFMTLLLTIVGTGWLAGSELGIETYKTYRRARKLYRAGKEFELTAISRSHYCNKVALEAAEKEWRKKRDIG